MPSVKQSPTITVVGQGYVGLTTAICFAERGFETYGFDVDKKKIHAIQEAKVPFFEPGLEELLRKHLGKLFQVSSDTLELSDFIFIAVGTPSKADGSIDLSYVRSACELIGSKLRTSSSYHAIIVKSSVVPKTTEDLVLPIIEQYSNKKIGKDLGLAFNPEFLKEGSALKDMFEPDRVVIGEHDEPSGEKLYRLYTEFYREKLPPILRTNSVNAEFIKYASNSFLATKITFINTIANIAQRTPGADVEVIAEGMGLDPRIGEKFLKAGLGFGGSCFPKDVAALKALSKSLGYDPLLLDAVTEVNARQPIVAVELAESFLGGLEGRIVSILGLSFKPETDDIREAVSVPIIIELLEKGAMVQAYDPIASENVSRVFPHESKITFAKSALDAISGSDSCLLVTEWEEFRKLEPEDFISRMRTPIVIDGRRILEAPKFSSKLEKFAAIGLGTEKKKIITSLKKKENS